MIRRCLPTTRAVVIRGAQGRKTCLAGMTFVFVAFIALLALPLTPAHAQCIPPQDGLVGHWKLDETSGTTANAVVGPNGTLSGGMDAASDTIAGQVGTALNFTPSEYIDMGDVELVTGDLTLAGWVKFDGFDADGDAIISKYHSGNLRAYGLVTSTSQLFQLLISDNGLTGAGALVSVVGTTTAQTGVWYHVAGTFNAAAGTAKIYVNGDLENTNTDAAVNGIFNTSRELRIGNWVSGAENYLDGQIDDARIYNRILNDDEIAALYATRSTANAPAGYMAYDSRHARMIYCNGTNWVHAGIGSWNPNAVTLDGTNDYLLRGADLTGNADSGKFTMSFWFKVGNNAANKELITTANSRFTVRFTATEQLQILASNSGGTGVLSVATTPTYADGNWHHALVSIDMASTSTRWIYVDGAAPAVTWTTYTAASTIDFTDTNYGIGATTAGGTKYIGDVADLWLLPGTYIDLSQTLNRAKFRNTFTGLPMYLGPDGGIPAGTAARIFLSNPTSAWQTNKGTGGNFTVTGALTTATTQPGDSRIPAGYPDIASNLAAYWKLDDGTGTTPDDSIGTNHASFNGTPAWETTARINGGIYFDSGDYLSVPEATLLDGSTNFSVATWVRFNSDDGSNHILVKTHSGAPWDSWVLDFSATKKFQFQVRNNAGTLFGPTASTLPLVPDTWYHLVGVKEGANVRLYINGVFDNEITNFTGTVYNSDSEMQMGGSASQWAGNMDDVRFYNRALSADDIKLLYTCSAPKGAVKYDSTFNVMTYCNGAEWVAMGTIGGTPPTNGLIGHWKLDDATGSSIADSAGSVTGAWTDGANNNVAEEAISGTVGGALDFDGNNEVNYGDALDLGVQDFTIALWLRVDDYSGQPKIIQKWVNATGTGYHMSVRTTGILRADIGDGTTSVVSPTTGTVLPTGSWIHVAVTFDRSGNMTRYVNGQIYGTQADISAVGSVDNINPLFLPTGLDGALDDVRIYNRVLSATEISQLYYYGLSGGLGDANNGCSNAGPMTGSTAEGKMFYNADHNVMQYCNGEWWVGIGK